MYIKWRIKVIYEMRKVKIVLEIFEKGDRVLTPCGEGIVMESEEIPNGKFDIYFRDVKVKIDD